VYFNGCFWNDNSVAIFGKTGQQTPTSAEIYIPYDKEVTGREYITPDEWNKLDIEDLDKYWTINTKQLPLMVKGENKHEFEWASPTASNRIAVQETAFLNTNANVIRAKDVNVQDFGSLNLQHVLIRV